MGMDFKIKDKETERLFNVYKNSVYKLINKRIKYYDEYGKYITYYDGCKKCLFSYKKDTGVLFYEINFIEKVGGVFHIPIHYWSINDLNWNFVLYSFNKILSDVEIKDVQGCHFIDNP